MCFVSPWSGLSPGSALLRVPRHSFIPPTVPPPRPTPPQTPQRTQDRLSEDKVTQYHQRLRTCLDQRDEMSADLRANMDALIQKYGK